MRTTIRAGLSGVAAAAVALGVAELLAVVAGARSAPLIAVGGVVVDHVPPAVKDFGISVFGVHDKTALLTGTAILLGLYAYGVGVLARRWWPVALGGIAVFGVLGAVAALTRPGAGAGAALPALIGAALAVPVLRHLLRRAASAQPAGTPPAGAVPERALPDVAYVEESRRRFVRDLGIVAAVAAGGGIAGRWLSDRGAVTSARGAVSLPAPIAAAPIVPAGAQVTGAVPYVTPNRDFYRIDTALIVPQVDPADWTLRINGMVRQPDHLHLRRSCCSGRWSSATSPSPACRTRSAAA